MEISKRSLAAIIAASIIVIITSVSGLLYMMYGEAKKTHVQTVKQEEIQKKKKEKKQEKEKEDSPDIQWLNMDKLSLTASEIENLKKAILEYNDKIDMYKIQDVDKFSEVKNENGTRKFLLKVSSYNFWYVIIVTVDSNHKITTDYYKNKIDYDDTKKDYQTDPNLQPD